MESLLLPTGVLQYDRERAYDGYTLFSPLWAKTTYLIDMEGQIVHEWQHETTPGRYAELLENGNLLRAGLLPKYTSMGGEGGLVQEIDWQGRVVWEYRNHSPESCQHHCFQRMKNGNTLVLCWRNHSYEECLAKGRRPELLPRDGIEVRGIRHTGLWVSYFLEINPAGEEVWRWDFWDHLGEGRYNLLDFNKVLPVRATWPDWDHVNNISYNEETDQILTTSRALGEFYIIDRKSGEIVYRWGNPANYGAGNPPSFASDGDQQLFGPHNPTWVGKGRVLVFDNGYLRPLGSRSRVLEVELASGKIVWEWMSPSPNSFNSALQSNAQRLPNGNTLISSCESGHVFEVSAGRARRYNSSFIAVNNPLLEEDESQPFSEVVWEFVNPVTGKGAKPILLHGTESLVGEWSNGLHRAYRYGKDFPGLAGRELGERRPFVADYPEGPWREWQEMVRKYY